MKKQEFKLGNPLAISYQLRYTTLMLKKGKTFAVYTFGCRLNQAESQLIKEKLLVEGLKETVISQADWVIINSCVVTQKAQKEVGQFVRRIRRENSNCQLWLVGCFADLKRIDHQLSDLPVDRWLTNKEKRAWLKGFLVPTSFKSQGRGLVKIQEGCQHFCSYCLVPYLRGKSVSLPADFVLNNVRRLVERGTKWVVLTGVEVIHYQDHNLDFLSLVEKILKQTSVKLISFGSISPLIGNGVERLIRLYQKFPQRLARHLHLSLQSGSNKILKLMNRGYSAQEYLSLAERLKKSIAGLNLTTDIIVGFPGETKEDFQETLALVKKIGFGKIHIFRFSPRPRTLAEKKAGQWGVVDEKTKKQRANQLAKLEKKLRLKFWRSLLGTEATALAFEKFGPKVASGQTDNFVPVLIKPIKRKNLGRLLKIRFEKIDGKHISAFQVN